MVNIIYDDQNQNLDPFPNPNNVWDPATEQGINNESIPSYVDDGSFLDIEYNADNIYYGMMTRIFHESSFGALTLLGDFIVVNIKHSTITGYPPDEFDRSDLRIAVFNFINANGGLNNAHFGHTSVSDYDSDGDGYIDMVQFIVRNSTEEYGGLKSGQGTIGSNFEIPLKANGITKDHFLVLSHQCVGNGRKAIRPTGIMVHEFSHALFGGNNFHTSGGNHYTGGGTNTWFGLEGGYGLMGAAQSSLMSCNGYERWRLNWISPPEYNPGGHVIQANGTPSDISKEDGPQSFKLRDFVTYGDAIRIKLPYIDENASNQYMARKSSAN